MDSEDEKEYSIAQVKATRWRSIKGEEGVLGDFSHDYLSNIYWYGRFYSRLKPRLLAGIKSLLLQKFGSILPYIPKWDWEVKNIVEGKIPNIYLWDDSIMWDPGGTEPFEEIGKIEWSRIEHI